MKLSIVHYITLALSLSFFSSCVLSPEAVIIKQDGKWDIADYTYEKEMGDSTLFSVSYADAGLFEFREDGGGLVTINVSGTTIPENQEILWTFDKEAETMTIDWQSLDPTVFSVVENEKDRQVWVESSSSVSPVGTEITTVRMTLVRQSE
ncbi:MAG: hypothetical protein AAFR61_01150 [Bacteroidota bacterium]